MFEVKNLDATDYIEEIVAERNHIFPFDLSKNMISILHNENYSEENKQRMKQYLSEKGITDIIWKEANDILISRCIVTYYTLVQSNNLMDVQLNHVLENGDILKLLDLILCCALDMNATDIHFFQSKLGLLVRFRVRGALKTFCILDKEISDDFIRAIKVKASIDISKNRNPRDGKIIFNYDAENIQVDIRVSVVPVVDNEKIHLRLLNQNSVPFEIDELEMIVEDQVKLNSFLKRDSGFLLITGPTSSGKSTTMRCCLNTIHDGEKHIISLEDPVEYAIEGITQVQVCKESEYGFLEALRAMLRQDPDVLAIGEIRDFETCNTAIQSSLTGHFVISTLHTKSAQSAIDRMVSIGINSQVLSMSLGLVVNQRLVRILCPACKEQEEYFGNDIEELSLHLGDNIYARRGCERCQYTGYDRQRPIFQVIFVDDEMKDEILQSGHLKSRKDLSIFKQVKQLFWNGDMSLEDAICFCEGDDVD